MSSEVEQLADEIATVFRSTDVSDSSSGNLERAAQSFINSKLQGMAEADYEHKQQLLITTVDASLNSQVATAMSTAIAAEIVATVSEDEAMGVEHRKKILRHFLNRVQQRSMVYEEIIITARRVIAKDLASEGRWEEAAQELREIRLDQLHMQVNNNTKFDVYLDIIKYYAMAGNQDQAVLALNRAASVVQTILDVRRIIEYR
ncbi:hypothetical protein LPJ75_004736, partial [Coemansia sp. RSA 2598]